MSLSLGEEVHVVVILRPMHKWLYPGLLTFIPWGPRAKGLEEDWEGGGEYDYCKYM